MANCIIASNCEIGGWSMTVILQKAPRETRLEKESKIPWQHQPYKKIKEKGERRI